MHGPSLFEHPLRFSYHKIWPIQVKYNLMNCMPIDLSIVFTKVIDGYTAMANRPTRQTLGTFTQLLCEYVFILS